MKIVSVNIGESKTIEWRGKKVQTGIYKYPVGGAIFLGNEDVKNDHVVDRRYHGGVDKACYSYAADHYKFWQNYYPELEMPWGMFGENLTTEGLHEADVNIGDTFKIGEAVIQATQPRQPCFKLGIRFGTQKMIKQFVDSGFPGVYFRVLKSGNVKVGDEIIPIKKMDSVSVQKVFELLYTDQFQKESIIKAINNVLLAKSCKNDLMKRWGDLLQVS